MKFTTDRPFADPEKAARRLMQHAHAFEPIQDGRIYIEKLNGPFLYVDRARRKSMWRASSSRIERGWLKMHESGTFVRFEQGGVGPVRIEREWTSSESYRFTYINGHRQRAARFPISANSGSRIHCRQDQHRSCDGHSGNPARRNPSSNSRNVFRIAIRAQRVFEIGNT